MDMEEEEGTKVPTTGWSREIWVHKQVPRGHPVEERVCVENKMWGGWKSLSVWRRPIMLCRFLWLIRAIKTLTRDMSPMTTMKKEFKYMILKRSVCGKASSRFVVGSRGRVTEYCIKIIESFQFLFMTATHFLSCLIPCSLWPWMWVEAA